MARLYRISTDTSEKEKAVGGILTFGQAGWIVVGLIIFAVVFIALAKIVPPVAALVIGLIPGAAVALPFAFFKKDELTLPQYLYWRIKFARKSRYAINTMTYRLDRPEEFQKKEEEVDLQ